MDARKRSAAGIDLATAPEREVLEALVHWDELAPVALEQLGRDAVQGPRLRRLQLAEAWLHERAAGDAPAAVVECPAAEELYDYGRGPGSRPLDAARRAEIDRHTLRCTPCTAFVATLERRPPVPLDLVPLAPAEPRAAAALRPRPRLLRAWMPLAAAAAALVLALPLLRRDEAPFELPGRPVLRDGGGSGALLLPRGPVLRTPGVALERLIELGPEPGADHYRVELRRHGGGAFDAGEPAGELHSSLHVLVLPDLPPGHYSYAVWARVDGLDRPLGARDFQVVEDPDLAASLARAGDEGDLRRLIAVLDGRGMVTDARALARLLPPSAERDRYLADPGR